MVATYNFGSGYTTLPHNIIKEKLIKLFEQTFYPRGVLLVMRTRFFHF